MRMVKEELVRIHEWKSHVAFLEALEEWGKRHNKQYLHLALHYLTPMTFE